MSEYVRLVTTRLKLDGEKEYSDRLKQISQNMRGLSSELVKLTAEYDGQLNSYEALSKKGDILNRQMDEQTKKQKVYADAIQEASKRRDEYNQGVANTTDKIAAEARANGENTETYKKLTDELKSYQEAAARAGNTIAEYQAKSNYADKDVAKLNKTIEENKKYLQEAEKAADGLATSIDGYGKAVKQAAEESEDFGQKGTEAINALAAALAAAGVAKTVKEIADMLKACVDASVDFEAAMSAIAATTGASASDMDRMGESVRKVALDTGESVTNLARSAKDLVEVDGDVELAISQLVAGSNLAIATNTDMSKTYDFLSAAMKTFALDTSETERTTGSFAYTTAKTNISLSQLADAYVNAGGAAANAGFDIDQVNAILINMSEAGLKGGAAGTALNGMLRNLSAPTEKAAGALKDLNIELYDNNGASREMFDIMRELESALAGLTDEQRNRYQQTIFDNVALKAWNMVTAQGVSDVIHLSNEISKSAQSFGGFDKAAMMAGVASNNAAGNIKKMDAAVNELKLSIGDALIPATNNLVSAGTNVTKWASDFVKENEWVVHAVTALGAALTVTSVAVGGLIVVVNVLIPAVKALGAAMGGLPIVGIVAAITAVAAAITSLIVTIGSGKSDLDEFRDSMQAIADTQAAAEKETLAMVAVSEKYINRLAELEKQGLENAEAQREYANIVALLNNAVPDLNIKLDEQTGIIEGGAGALWDTVNAWKEAALAQVKYAAGMEYLTAQATAQYALEKAERDLIDAVLAREEAQKLLNAAMEDQSAVTDAIVSGLDDQYETLNRLTDAVVSAEYEEERLTKVRNDAATALDEATTEAQKYEDVWRNAIGITNQIVDKTENLNESLANQADTLRKYADAAKSITTELKKFESALKEQSKEGQLSLDTTLSLIDAGYGAALAINAESGAVTLNKDAYIELMNAKTAERKATLQEAIREASALAMDKERIAAEMLAKGLYGLAQARLVEAAAANAEVAGLEAGLAAIEKAATQIKISGGSGGGGGGGKAASASAQREREEKERLDAEKKAAEELEKSIEKAVTAVKTGYLTLQEAAEVFGVNLEQITERHSLESLYSEQMQGAIKAVRSGTTSVFDAMKQYSVEYDDLIKALESYNGNMRKLYDEQRDMIDYQYKMGKISAQNYYDELTKLRDKYLEENSQAWRSATVELNSIYKDMAEKQASALNAAMSKQQTALKENLEARKKLIQEELDLEKKRLNAIIDGINAEIQARRNLRADENAEEKIKQAEQRVADARRMLDAAETQKEYARDDADRAEAEKLVLQRQNALNEAIGALEKTRQDYEDQLWYREKQSEIETVKTQIAAAEQKAATETTQAQTTYDAQIKYIADQAARDQEALLAKMQKTMESVAAEMVTNVAASAAGAGAAAAISNVVKSANLNVTYTTTTATSAQVAALVDKTLERL